MKLISALGENYDIIMEMIDFLNGDFPYTEITRNTKESFAEPLDEIVLFCTIKTIPVFQELKKILILEYPDIQLKKVNLGIEDITSVIDDEKTRRIVFDVLEQYLGEKLILSSAGRKDITQRIIEGGYIYGFYGYLSVTFSAEFQRYKKNIAGLKDYQIIRKHPECLSVNWYPLSTLLRRKYHLPEKTSADGQQVICTVPLQTEQELIQSFPALYSLPLALIYHLKSEKIGTDLGRESADYQWLSALPKTDLHCHFGGTAGPYELKAIAEAIFSDNLVYVRWKEEIPFIRKKLRDRSLEEWLYKRKGTAKNHPLYYLKEYYRGIDDRLPVFLMNAVQLDILSSDEISRLMWPEPAQRRMGDGEPGTEGLDMYMDTGNFGGTLLFQTKSAMVAAINCLLMACLKDNIRYIEVRISPMNYCDAGLNTFDVVKILLETSEQFIKEHPSITVNFIIIATRHKDMASVIKNISTAVVFSEYAPGKSYSSGKNYHRDNDFIPRVCGVDLAGKEKDFSPVQFVDMFHLFITILLRLQFTQGRQKAVRISGRHCITSMQGGLDTD
ncbi:MAG: hypothetical protein ACUBOA_12980 [Candidatus Loosdrechtia sp.]|uniref:hypothetical protein n=1 Tax=Candidatus Loosdrechtia sp. TaxID=3101272 RepID=UPI003A722A76|nr:MAG: hypothetical protein QY305_09500 [Candidatus Jettenia sp. AMX2]